MHAEQIIIQKIASRPSTEELIFFVTENEAISSACSELQKKIVGHNKKELEKINALCRRYQISLVDLSRELNHIQNIFMPREVVSDDHKLLGLPAESDISEVKQAYRRLSIKHHPDTADQKDTEKFIQITEAYRRILKSKESKTKNANTHPSSSAWRYKKNTSPVQKGKNKYIYFFLLVISVIIFIIITSSINYKKKAMLSNISKTQPASSKQSSPPKEPVVAQDHPLVSNQLELNKKIQDIPTIVPSDSKSMAQVLPPASEEQKTDQVENNATPMLSSESPPRMKHTEDAQEISVQETDQEESEPVIGVNKPNDFVTKRFNQKKSGEKKGQVTALPETTRKTSTEQTADSLFSGTPYQRALVVKPTEKKIRKKKLPTPDVRQASQKRPAADALRKFIKNYTVAYRSRDIKKISSFFAKGALENNEPFSRVRAKYEQLFRTTRSIEYTIDLLSTDVQNKGASATLTGKFEVKLLYSSNKTNSSSGTIIFSLIKQKKSYKIKALTYQLDP